MSGGEAHCSHTQGKAGEALRIKVNRLLKDVEFKGNFIFKCPKLCFIITST
jgi:hypothetical protein